MKKDLLIMIGMCLTVLFGFQMTNPSVTLDTQSVHTVTVQKGDTVWDIANRVTTHDIEVRQVVYAVKELNNIDDAGALVPGTTLQVPTVKEVSPVRALDYVAQN